MVIVEIHTEIVVQTNPVKLWQQILGLLLSQQSGARFTIRPKIVETESGGWQRRNNLLASKVVVPTQLCF